MTVLSSDAGWSGEPDGDDEERAVAERPTNERYEWQDVLGAGGMGTVHVVVDRHLRREVALKQVRASFARDDRRADRLRWEAWVTARLEHPAIVAVYDAGEGDDRRVFFTMRVVRGQSLAEALADATDADDHDRLLRAFLVVCEAVAYAHSRGVVHRDLKPQNIMLGAFGEVQIVDWGLAGLTVAAPPEVPYDALVRVGTQGYASPEQVEGAPPDPRADVFSLGVILAELSSAARGVERSEPAAIAEKACNRELGARYQTAGELVAELRRYLAGRRVQAFEYSPWASLKRLAVQYRWPFIAIAAALVAGVVSFAVSYGRIVEQRERAVQAETDATNSLERTRQTLRWGLENQASTALSLGRLAEAEIFAAQALLHGDSPEARGVLAAVHGGGRVEVERMDSELGCDEFVFGERSLVCLDDEGARLYENDESTARWSTEIRAETAVIADERILLQSASSISVLDRETGRLLHRMISDGPPSDVLVSADGSRTAGAFSTRMLIPDGEMVQNFAPCAYRAVHAMTLGSGRAAIACGEGELHLREGRVDGPPLTIPFGASLSPAFAMGFSPSDARLAVGAVDGQLLIVEADGSVGAPFPVADRPIAQVAFVDERHLMVRTDDGVVRWVDTSSRQEVLAFPRSTTARLSLIGGRMVTSRDASRWRWTLPRVSRPRRLVVGAGLSSAWLSPQGWVAMARGDGIVSVFATNDGRPLAHIPVANAVIKRLAGSADGSELFVAIAQEQGSAVIDTATWRIVRRSGGERATRRVGVLDDGTARGTVLSTGYVPGLGMGDPTQAATILEAGAISDMAVFSDASAALLLADDGTLSRFETPERWTTLLELPFARSVFGDSEHLAVSRGARVELRSMAAPEHRLQVFDTASRVEDVAMSSGGDRVAVGTLDGSVYVWSIDGSLLAHVHASDDRVVWVEFENDERLAAASWDGSLVYLDLEQLERDADEVRLDSQQTWGVSLDQVLDGRPSR